VRTLRSGSEGETIIAAKTITNAAAAVQERSKPSGKSHQRENMNIGINL
jgi:hypothetical protein